MAMMILGACSSDVKDSQLTVTYPTVNLITPLDGGETLATAGKYTFQLNTTKLMGSVSTSDLKIDNRDYRIETDTVKYENYTTSMGGTLIRMRNLKGYVDNNKDMPVNVTGFDLNNLTYHTLIHNIAVPGYNYPEEYTFVVGQYTAGDWYVATIQKDASYFGKTTTTYADITEPGKTKTYENENMVYRVIIDITKKTADVILYNAKFAEEMPKALTAIILKGLNVTWHKGSYEIEGENIVPEVVEGNSTTPNEGYMFNKFKFATMDVNLLQASITYEVRNGAFKGEFHGKCALEP